MRIPPVPHRWSLTPRQAIALQQRLAQRIEQRPLTGRVRYVAGADMAFSPDGEHCVAGIVVYDLEEQTAVEEALAVRRVRFPYVPGLLSFRETPTVLAAARKLKCEPDVFMFDAHGYAHPRRFGLACHAGLLLGKPSIGCAKTRLCGQEFEPAARIGSTAPLVHNGEQIGLMLRTRAGVKPVYISVGNRVTLEDAVRIALACVTRYRIPEPTRLAHQLVTRSRTQLI